MIRVVDIVYVISHDFWTSNSVRSFIAWTQQLNKQGVNTE